jgi:hypothetical protein
MFPRFVAMIVHPIANVFVLLRNFSGPNQPNIVPIRIQNALGQHGFGSGGPLDDRHDYRMAGNDPLPSPLLQTAAWGRDRMALS